MKPHKIRMRSVSRVAATFNQAGVISFGTCACCVSSSKLLWQLGAVNEITPTEEHVKMKMKNNRKFPREVKSLRAREREEERVRENDRDRERERESTVLFEVVC